MPLIAGLVGVPLAVGWLGEDRPGLGPVPFTLSRTHGGHAFDVVLLVAAGPPWLVLAARTGRCVRRRRRRRAA